MKFFRFFCGAFIICCSLFTIFFGRYKIAVGGVDTSPESYKGVITVWQIDSFEGGVGSRKQFLLNVARQFEKQNKGVLVMVINQTPEGVLSAYENGEMPDLISYGTGVEVRGYGQIFVDKSVAGGMVGDGCYATAWCRGGYLLISNPSLTTGKTDEKKMEELLVSQGEYTQPLTALALEGYTADEVEVFEPMTAYIKFTTGKVKYFLATQRDVSRLINRGMEFSAQPLNRYNDLYQYISVTSEKPQKRFYAEQFVNYLISDKVQKTLSSIGMYSPYIDVEYDDARHQLMQSARSNFTVSAFSSPIILKEMQRLSQLAITGDKEAINKIKNMCVMS